MKSIAVIYLGRRGGGPVYAYEMTRGLIENGYRVYAFISAGVENLENWRTLKTEMTEEIRTYDSEVSFVTRSIAFRAREYSALKKKYKNVKIDACYIPMAHTWASYIVNLFPDAQVIDTIHDPIPHSTNRSLYEGLIRLGDKLMKLGVKKRKPDDIVILSKAFLDCVCQKYEMDAAHVHVIPHGVFDYYQKCGNGRVFTYPLDKINFLFFGRICAYKGIDVLAEAFRAVKEQLPTSTLTVVGSGDFSAYEQLYRDLPDVTVVNEWISDEDVAGYFQTDATLILVLPYVDATQSGVIPIAMSCGVPVIASNTGGLAEQVEDGVTGRLCLPNNAEDLARCMMHCARADNSEIIQNAKDFIQTLSWDRLSAQLGDLVR